MYPGSPSPAVGRRPAGNHGDAGLGEAGYRVAETPASTRPGTGGADVPGLAEPGGRETPGRESRRRRPRRGRVQGCECTRGRRARRSRDARLVSEQRSADEGASAGVSDPGYRGVADPRTIRRCAGNCSRGRRPRPVQEMRRLGSRTPRTRVRQPGSATPATPPIVLTSPSACRDPCGVFMPSQVPLATYFQWRGS